MAESIRMDSQYKFRKNTDVLFEKEISQIKLNGFLNKAISFVEKHQSLNKDLWKIFVDVFRTKPDSDGERWRGEYFGKMMRGACFLYKVTGNAELFEVLKSAVIDLLSTQEESGRISSYKQSCEFLGWDMWSRKYVLLGLEYFVEISKDKELNERITNALIKHADYILNKVGEENNKIDILDTSSAWGCVNSCTILEPMIKLYAITGLKRYLDFSEYIIKSGGCKLGSLIDMAYKNEVSVYEYPTTKAYEMMSFFDGVAEYLSINEDSKLKTAFFNFTERIINDELSIIGSCGCTHELFDHTKVRQTTDDIEVMQETCVTVTVMKLFTRALELTGDSKYADLVERSYYNAMLGSLNLNQNDELYWGVEFEDQFDYTPTRAFVKKMKGLTFDSYSPLYKNARNRKTGGYNVIDDDKCYGCCTCIGALGIATLPLYSVMKNNNGLTINYYLDEELNLSVNEKEVFIKMETLYPFDKSIKISIKTDEPLTFDLALRIPSFVDYAIVDGVKVDKKGYYNINREFFNDTINVEFIYDLKINEINDKIALTYGNIVYAVDNRIDSIDKCATNDIKSYEFINKEFNAMSELKVKFSNDEEIKFINYSSSGSNWYRGTNKLTVFLDKE